MAQPIATTNADNTTVTPVSATAPLPVAIAYEQSAGGAAVPVTPSNPLPVNASVTASISPFQPLANRATLAVTNASGNVALPTNSGSISVYNAGSKTAYVNLSSGAGTATTGDFEIASGEKQSFGTTGIDHLNAICGGTDTTTLNLSGGSGLMSGVTAPGGGASAVTVADGADVTQGAQADVAVSGDNSGTVSAKLRGINKALAGTLTVGGTVTANAGTNLNTSALALESGGNLSTVASTQVATGTTAPSKVEIVGGKTSDATPQYQPIPLTNGGAAVKTDGSATTQPISAASLPLPTGASTAAKQPALGTAGSASADVITVQGIASMTALKVDGSGVTQPVSGTFWQATQPVSISSAVTVVGDAPSGSAVTGNPLLLAGRAATANPSAVSDGQVADLMTDILGKLVTVLNAPRALKGATETTISSTTQTSIIAAGGVGVFTDIELLWINNTSATAVRVDITDGTLTIPFYVPAGDVRGISAPTMLSATSSNTAWQATLSSAVTDIRIVAYYAKRTG